MKRRWILGMFAIVISTVASLGHAAIADSSNDDPYAERQRLDLQDQEKQLLREEDRLKQDVDQLKRAIALRLDKVDIAQRRLERINHDLITLRMKMMP
ncbi:MAG TPA: hypothetical protein V6D22_06450 [Candidatus Obscuribacterales bacterium]